MKTIYKLSAVLLLLINSNLSIAQTKTATSNGDWNDPTIWTPSGVPFLEDVVIIDADVTISTGVVLCGNCTDLTINTGKSLTNNSGGLVPLTLASEVLTVNGVFVSNNPIILGGSLINNGTTTINSSITVGSFTMNTNQITVQNRFTTDSLVNTHKINSDSVIATSGNNSGNISTTTLSVFGDLYTNTGSIYSDDRVVTNNMTNYGSIVTQGNLVTGGTFDQKPNSIIDCGDTLDQRATFTNNSQVITNHLSNIGHLTGATGKVCIANYYNNYSIIDGTIDVCDATPNSANDSNIGTIAGTVTNCAVSSCVSNVGVDNNILPKQELLLYPNPAYNLVSIKNLPLNSTVTVYNNVGKLCLSTQQNIIDISNLSNGIYYVKVSSKNNISVLKLVKK